MKKLKEKDGKLEFKNRTGRDLWFSIMSNSFETKKKKMSKPRRKQKRTK